MKKLLLPLVMLFAIGYLITEFPSIMDGLAPYTWNNCPGDMFYQAWGLALIYAVWRAVFAASAFIYMFGGYILIILILWMVLTKAFPIRRAD